MWLTRKPSPRHPCRGWLMHALMKSNSPTIRGYASVSTGAYDVVVFRPCGQT